jgi:hypothetical protein
LPQANLQEYIKYNPDVKILEESRPGLAKGFLFHLFQKPSAGISSMSRPKKRRNGSTRSRLKRQKTLPNCTSEPLRSKKD